MAQTHNREKQAEVLRHAQAQKKEQKKQQVLKAIQEILEMKKPLTFANIATVAGCSISYLYKWDEIKEYIHSLQKYSQTQLHPLSSKEPLPHSLKTLHEIAKQRMRELEAEIRELKKQNEKLRGHVTQIYELTDECSRLRTQLRELTSPTPSNKVIPISPNFASDVVDKIPETKATLKNEKTVRRSKSETQDNQTEILNSIKSMGIKIGKKLREEIANRDLKQVRLAIEAFRKYRNHHSIANPSACLLSMIRDQAQPNTPLS